MTSDLTHSNSTQEHSEGLSRLKLQFLASLNHEIRTPLSGVVGMTDLLLETPLSEDQKEYVVATRDCANQLFDLLNTTLAYNALLSGNVKSEAHELEPADFFASLEAEFREKAARKGLALEVVCGADIAGALRVDEYHLRQVCSVLLNNSIKFTTHGTIRLSIHHQDGRLRISVEDTGIGIPAEQLPYLFEPFRQGEHGADRGFSGLGLGLALAQGLIRLMGGDLTVESELGHGSSFRVLLPAGLEDEGTENPVEAESPLPPERVLLVEDDRISQRIITAILSKAGAHCDSVPDGISAIRQVEEIGYGMILMDLQMPGIDGFETARRIRELPAGKSLPIVALTANSDDETRARCWKAGMAAFLSKPVQPSELLTTIQQFVRLPVQR